MEIIPAVDISNGKCVRLYKGLKGTETIYFDDPLRAINFWIEKGAERLHLIDLDGAWGSETNKLIFQNLLKRASNKIKIQVGGGIRTIEAALELIRFGADRLILGTFALKNPIGLKKLTQMIGFDKIIVAIDYKNQKIAVKGWTEMTERNPLTFGREIEKLGVNYVLFSSIEADGTLGGPDFSYIKKMMATVKKTQIYVAGGVRNIEDIEKLEEIGVMGVIIGKAFYEHSIPFTIIKNSK